MALKQILRMYHTCRYLRLRQVYYRLYYLLCSSNVINEFNFNTRNWEKRWNSPPSMPSKLSSTGEMTFLGESGRVVNASSWNDSGRSKLWLYNLHYFDELNTENSDNQADVLNELIANWIDHNPPFDGIGWEPYPLSLRIVNFVKWFSRQNKSVPSSWLVSLGTQADALLSKLEYHILGNHIFANGKALVFAGAFGTGSRADTWLKKGIEILDQEIKEQFLPDGGHFELSPMYHSTLLWDMCDLVNLAQCVRLNELNERQSAWSEIILKGLNWLKIMLHPDENIPFFNDAAFDIAPGYANLEEYARKLGLNPITQLIEDLSVNWLSDSGYCAVNIGTDCKAIVDIAKVGPDYQPGHAHADTLSFELSLFKQRFIVNSGTSQYGNGEQRHFERSTQAHNTITINGENSSEVWSGFRVARRAYPEHQVVEHKDDSIYISASHDGYKRLHGCNIHKREWRFTRKKLIINDLISGNYLDASFRLYFHPSVMAVLEDEGLIRCNLDKSKEIFIKFTGYSNLALESSFWYPKFGDKQKNLCLVAKIKTGELLTEVMW